MKPQIYDLIRKIYGVSFDDDVKAKYQTILDYCRTYDNTAGDKEVKEYLINLFILERRSKAN